MCRLAKMSAPKKETYTHTHAHFLRFPIPVRTQIAAPARSLLFSFGTFDSFLVGVGRNWT